jgi:cell division protein FtsB
MSFRKLNSEEIQEREALIAKTRANIELLEQYIAVLQDEITNGVWELSKEDLNRMVKELKDEANLSSKR